MTKTYEYGIFDASSGSVVRFDATRCELHPPTETLPAYKTKSMSQILNIFYSSDNVYSKYVWPSSENINIENCVPVLIETISVSRSDQNSRHILGDLISSDFITAQNVFEIKLPYHHTEKFSLSRPLDETPNIILRKTFQSDDVEFCRANLGTLFYIRKSDLTSPLNNKDTFLYNNSTYNVVDVKDLPDGWPIPGSHPNSEYFLILASPEPKYIDKIPFNIDEITSRIQNETSSSHTP